MQPHTFALTERAMLADAPFHDSYCHACRGNAEGTRMGAPGHLTGTMTPHPCPLDHIAIDMCEVGGCCTA
jgi:hypothetical protein